MDKSRIDKIAWWIPSKKLRSFFRDFCDEHNRLLEDNKNKSISIDYDINKIKELNIAISEKIYNNEILSILTLNKYNQVYGRLYRLWYCCYDHGQLLKICEILSKRDNIWKYIDNKFWLIYISLLCEYNQDNLSKILLTKYIDRYKLLDIEKFILVLELSKKLHYTNELIEQSFLIKTTLDKSIENNIFENIIKGKSVAVVGNGPQEIGKGKGKEIDSYDIVVRFNNFQLEGFEKDYGTKTNIWSNNRGEKQVSGLEKLILYIVDIDYRCVILDDYNRNLLYKIITETKLNITNVSRKDTVDRLNHYKPTTGSMTLLKIKDIKDKNNETFTVENIYGFSFLYKNNNGLIDHYYKDLSYEKSKKEFEGLNFNYEIEYLQKVFGVDQTRPDQT